MPRKRPLPPLAPRKRPTQARAHRTYLALLQAGARILERRGYEALTTNHVAELAGVGIASLYEYFPNKQALVAEVVRHVLDEVLADLRASASLVTQGPPADATRAWIAAMFAAVAKRRGVVTVISQEVPFLWDIAAVTEARDLLLELAFATRDLHARTTGTPPVPDATVHVLATMTGAAVLEAVLRPSRRHGADELITALAEIVDRVTRPTTPAPAPRDAPRAPAIARTSRDDDGAAGPLTGRGGRAEAAGSRHGAVLCSPHAQLRRRGRPGRVARLAPGSLRRRRRARRRRPTGDGRRHAPGRGPRRDARRGVRQRRRRLGVRRSRRRQRRHRLSGRVVEHRPRHQGVLPDRRHAVDHDRGAGSLLRSRRPARGLVHDPAGARRQRGVAAPVPAGRLRAGDGDADDALRHRGRRLDRRRRRHAPGHRRVHRRALRRDLRSLHLSR
ncbi:MAG: TetR/AcrR family transcriptional regulator [Kofleriaceae bacterium]|nr:TetR/AcrR family transcriptional regulator [Kofleriaceae bacterium]